MIEHCSNLRECEHKLAREAQKARLLGEISHSPDDLHRLGALIRQEMSPDIAAGTRFLRREAPTCLACFLVWMGTLGYQDGSYWSAIEESVGLADPNWQTTWGQIFVHFLETKKLPLFDIEGGLRYVTPILAHGGIPNSCLDEFFEKVLLPLVQRDLMDPSDPGEITHELARCREDDRGRAEVEHRCGHLQEQANSLKERVRRAHHAVEAYEKVTSLWQDETAVRALDLPPELPTDYEAFKAGKRAGIRRLEDGLCGLRERQASCQQVVAEFTEHDIRALDRAEDIEQSIAAYGVLKEQQETLNALASEEKEVVARITSQSGDILTDSWTDEHCRLVKLMPLDELRDQIVSLQSIVSEQEEAQCMLDSLATSRAPTSSAVAAMAGASVLLVLGLIVVAIGVYAARSWVLTLAGVGCTATVGFAGWLWNRSTTKRSKQLETLEHTLKDTASRAERLQKGIARTLGNLAVVDKQLRSPSLGLYQALATLAQTCKKLSELREKRMALQGEIRHEAQRIEDVAADIGIQPTQELISTMDLALREARQRQAATASAERELHTSLWPKTRELEAAEQAIRDELARVEAQLAKLGGGRIQAGIAQAKEQRESRERVAEIRRELEEEYPDFDSIEDEIRVARAEGKDNNGLGAEARQLEEECEKIQAQADLVREELSHYPTVFSGVDEPIRRSLLHAGESAEEFLVAAVLLAHRSLVEGNVPGAEEAALPERVVAAFRRWFPENVEQLGGEEVEVRDTATGRRFRRPGVFLDTGMAEIVVHLHAQRYPTSIAGSSACLEVIGLNRGTKEQAFPLRVYSPAEDLLETQELEFPLPFPADRYRFDLKSDNTAIHSWETALAYIDAPCIAFDWRSGRLIKEEQLPRGKVWCLLPNSFSLRPNECTLEKSSLHGPWKNYTLHGLDLEEVDQLEIVDDLGQYHPIPLSSEVVPALDLVGGQLLGGVRSDGDRVYIGRPPAVRVPIEDGAELRQWQVSIVGEEGIMAGGYTRHYRLSELQTALGVHLDQGWVDVSLANESLLGERPFGRFAIRMRRRPHIDWRSRFCMVRHLGVAFEKQLYPPHEPARVPDIRAAISISQPARFIPNQPARITDTDDSYYSITIPGTEDALTGMLIQDSPDGSEQEIPLTLSIPKVKWRVQGIEDDQFSMWCDTIHEVWFGDWDSAPELSLLVALPSSVGGPVTLSLDGDYAREDVRALREGRARFDLLAFGDALRAGQSVQEFALKIEESGSPLHAPLFRARTRWEVEDLECVQRLQGRDIILKVTWTEQGRTGNKAKVARLWSSSGAPVVPIIEQEVHEGDESVTLRAKIQELPPGRYVLHLSLRDPWSTTKISCPAWNDPNTSLIEIVPTEVVRQGEVLRIRSIADDRGQPHELAKRIYRVTIAGKIVNRKLPSEVAAGRVLVTRTNEGWYVGHLEVVGDPDLEAAMEDTNPVKFEYDPSKDEISAIEDRHGEGAMYCSECRRLYWSHEMNLQAKLRNHPVFGPVEVFYIDWES